MDDFITMADFTDEELSNANCLSPLDILAVVAQKAMEKDYPSLLIEDISEKPKKKTLPFDLNLKPRTHRRPRTTPIDVHALLPCLYPVPDSVLNRSLKKRRITDEECECESPRAPKKRRWIAPPVPQPLNPELPVEYRQKIEELGGWDVRFVIQKKLYDADVSSSKSRLTMPYRQCRVDFGKVEKTQVKLIHKDGNEVREMMMTFLMWDKVSSYVFNGTWNNLVSLKGLKTNDVVQVWSFKLGAEFAFALLKL
ncbi:hypothetical protein vseg_016533 [Gypsophila vaccaria]